MIRPHASRCGMTAYLVAAAALCAVVAVPALAHAKSQRVVRYSFEQVWPAAIRFLRVDSGLEILERDAEAGYVLFELSEENKRFRGALELVRIVDDRDRPALRMILHIEDRPSYMELALLKRLERKLRDELGPPREPAPKPKPRPKEGDEPKGKDS